MHYLKYDKIVLSFFCLCNILVGIGLIHLQGALWCLTILKTFLGGLFCALGCGWFVAAKNCFF